jgi:hypothetical protein
MRRLLLVALVVTVDPLPAFAQGPRSEGLSRFPAASVWQPSALETTGLSRQRQQSAPGGTALWVGIGAAVGVVTSVVRYDGSVQLILVGAVAGALVGYLLTHTF